MWKTRHTKTHKALASVEHYYVTMGRLISLVNFNTQRWKQVQVGVLAHLHSSFWSICSQSDQTLNYLSSYIFYTYILLNDTLSMSKQNITFVFTLISIAKLSCYSGYHAMASNIKLLHHIHFPFLTVLFCLDSIVTGRICAGCSKTNGWGCIVLFQ